MDFDFFFKGLILGFSVAAPVGPIGILCINRTLNKSYVSGLMTGLGAATADLLYGLIAGLGLTVISGFLVEQKFWFQSIGLVVLFYLGMKTLSKKKVDMNYRKMHDKGLFKDFLSTFLLVVTNPVTIFFFLTVFASLGLADPANQKLSSIPLVVGVFLGSGFWWFLLSGITIKLKNKIGSKTLKIIDLFSGILILSFALYMLVDIVIVTWYSNC